jgi:3-oxoacyl-[acyl-carrier protein] reductase
MLSAAVELCRFAFSFHLLFSLVTTSSSFSPRPIAIITGGTRGIGRGIASVLASEGYDLILTFNSDKDAASSFAAALVREHKDNEDHSNLRVECVGGDISLVSTRDEIFDTLDSMRSGGQRCLEVLVHNAGQYVGITSDNCDGISAPSTSLSFGDGSLLDENGQTNLTTMKYYQRLYGEAFVDLCERSLARMDSTQDGSGGGGTIVGISAPSVCAHYYNPDWSYSMPGAGKSLMEYSMRIYATKVASRGINVNVIVPGVTQTDAWTKIAKRRGLDDSSKMMEAIIERGVPLKKVVDPTDIGNFVKFLCTGSGKFITGQVIPFDGGMHLKQ